MEEQLCNKNYLLLQFPHRVSYALRISAGWDVQTAASVPLLRVRVVGVREIVPLM